MRKSIVVAAIFAALNLHGQAQAQQKLDVRKISSVAGTKVSNKLGSVTDRAYPELHQQTEASDDELGLRLGTFIVEPQLEISGFWTSNANRTNTNPESDFGVSLKPQLSFKSDWPRHSLQGKVDADVTRYLDTDTLNVSEINGEIEARIDIRQDTKLELSASYDTSSTRAGSGEVPGTATGSRQDNIINASAALIQEFGRLQWRGSFDIKKNNFGDVNLSGGGSEDNSDREFLDTKLALRTTYNNDGALSPFLQLNYTPRTYDQALDRNGQRRSSQGYGIDLGVSFDDDAIWSGDIALSYAWRNPSDANLSNESVLGLNGNLTWKPLNTASLKLNLSTDLAETITLNTTANRNWSASLDYEQSITEFLRWKAGASLNVADAAIGLDKTYGLSSSVEWDINRFVALSLGYSGTWLDANETPSRDFTEQRLITSIILRR